MPYILTIETETGRKQPMRGKELIRKVKKNKAIGPDFRVEAKRGKGGHVTCHYRGRKTTISPNKEFSKAVAKEFLKQLGIDPEGIV